MSDQEPSTRQKVVNVVVLTVLLTILVWWQEEDLVDSPVTLVLAPVVVVSSVVLTRFSRSRADRKVARDTAGAPRRSRPWAEVPSAQRQRFWVSSVSSVLLVLVLLPLIVLGLPGHLDDPVLWFLVVLLLAAPASTAWVWWSVRHPTELTAAREERRTGSIGRVAAVFGLLVVSVWLARAAYELVDPEVLRLLVAGVVCLVGSVLMVALSARLAGRPVPEKQVW